MASAESGGSAAVKSPELPAFVISEARSQAREGSVPPEDAACHPLPQEPRSAWGELPSTTSSKYIVSPGSDDGCSGGRLLGGHRELSRGVSSASDATHLSVVFADEKRFELDATSQGPGRAAGTMMAKASSGQRLKSRDSYQRHTDVKVLRAAMGAEAARAGVALEGGDDDEDTADRGQENASLASTALMEDLGRRRHRRKGVLAVIPLWVQVCILMLVPIAFVSTYLSMTLHAAVRDYRFIIVNEPVLTQLTACERELFLGRELSTHLLVLPEGEERDRVMAALVAQRQDADRECNELIMRTLESSIDVVRRDYHDALRRALGAIRVTRFAIEHGAIGAMDYLRELRRLIAEIDRGIIIIARESSMARRFVMLSYLRGAANRMSNCRAMLLEMSTVGSMQSEDMRVALDSECIEPLRRHIRDVRELAQAVALRQLHLWDTEPEVRAAVALMQAFVELPLGASFNMSSTQVFDQLTPAIDRLEEFSMAVIGNALAAKNERAAMLNEGIKLGATLLVSLIGVLFVSRAQRLATERVDFALERTHKMSLAVQAFIPRSFLRLMAAESILNLERGDQTQVAVTMLFCDIRNFTGISEHMTNEQLFEWLQAHLKRMTRTTEAHRGFVSAYIGDAVSAIFLTPMDACRCAIKMQAVTDALCYELVAHNEDHMVRIGVGVHHALVGVGILGNDKHHSCAIVSAEVNVANQLEALTKEYGARIIVTGQAHDQLPRDAFESRPLGRVRLSKSAVREYVLYEVFQADMPEAKAYKSATQEQWEQLLGLRECEQFDEAAALLCELEATAAKNGVKDLAIEVKRRSGKSACDVFED